MNGMDIGRLLITLGMALIVLGGVVMLLSRFTSLGHLPGDIFIRTKMEFFGCTSTRQLLFSCDKLHRRQYYSQCDLKSVSPLSGKRFLDKTVERR